MRDCLKQKTRCVVYADGERYEATNSCAVGDDVTECPRVTAGCATGEGYELCDPIHAEVAVAALVPEGAPGGSAALYGHNWFCGPCQWALLDKGVRVFIITGQPA